MKKYIIIFRESKNRFKVIKKFDELSEAFDYITNYSGYHRKSRLFVKEETAIINPFKRKKSA